MKLMPLVTTMLLSVVSASSSAFTLPQMSDLSPHSSTQACQGAWNASSASRSCHVNRIDGRPGTQCYVDVRCVRNNGSQLTNQYTMEEWGVRALANCDGFLRVGGC
jgi:hypothetical protein